MFCSNNVFTTYTQNEKLNMWRAIRISIFYQWENGGKETLGRNKAFGNEDFARLSTTTFKVHRF